jgi:uncharacterized protein (DUF2267 family)
MAAIRELGAALRATDDCVDDLMRRLCDASLGTITTVSISLCSQHCMRCVDCLGQDEAVHVHLPALLRGLFYEGWHSGGYRAAKTRHAFLASRIHDGVHRDPGVDAEQVARAVLALLAARLPAPELEDAKAATPKELHNLWPS